MAFSEGGREVLEAARKRLATAKSKVSSSSTNLESIKQMLVNAQSMYDADEKEYKEAQTALEEAEKKYEVIDVDLDDPEPTDNGEGSNKRRKVSLSPQNNNNTTNQASNYASATQNIAAAGSRTNNNVINNSSITAPTITSTSSSTFIVGGCGLSEVNGTYTRVDAKYNHNGAPMYSKQGQWKGNTVVYVIYWRSTTKQWCIGHTKQDVDAGTGVPGGLCRSQPNVSRLAPPGNGWYMQMKTSAVTPSSSFVNQVVVLGCSTSGVNGVYKQKNGSSYKNAPLFTKEVGSTTFAIYRVLSNQAYWYIGR